MGDAITATVARWCSFLARGIRRAWNESAAAQEALAEINRPWRSDGELRWRRAGRGWELHGEHLPVEPRTG